MTHSDDTDPIYVRGKEASLPLALLAENGDPTPLLNAYSGRPGVGSVIHSSNDDTVSTRFSGRKNQRGVPFVGF